VETAKATAKEPNFLHLLVVDYKEHMAKLWQSYFPKCLASSLEEIEQAKFCSNLFP
jgi:hypothetical protein